MAKLIAVLLTLVFAVGAYYAQQPWVAPLAVIGAFIAGALLWRNEDGGSRFGDPTAPSGLQHKLHAHKTIIGRVVAEPEDNARVLALAQSGKKIAAIKALRQVTGMSLAEAKEAVEEMLEQARET